MGAVYTLPIDNIKTRLQNQSADPSKNRLNYKSVIDVVSNSIKYEGLNGLFVGGIPYYLKILTYTTLVYSHDSDRVHD